jgi:putative endonuclease
MSGARSYYAGLAAEEAVQRHYEKQGHDLLAHRWRGTGGEIDLIFEKGEGLVFVEVKTSTSLEAAIASLSVRQIGRITDAAAEFAGDTLRPIRIDLAAVDGAGHVEVIANITI